MMKSNGIKLAKIIAAICLFTGLLLALNQQIVQSPKEKAALVKEQESRLNVAIVNEDQGGEFEGTVYNLAKNYIKQLEKDDSHQWTVVSRSAAELGLEQGTYQLAIFIPNQFTSKLLDINAVAPEKTIITYKVNSSGNRTVEQLAKQTGQKIITDLNQQLVDMFMASILGNLYTAQQNVQSVIDTQQLNIGNYQQSIYDNATNFKSNLPSLMEIARSSGTSNDQLITNLSSLASLYDELQVGQTGYSTELTDLIAKRSNGQINHAAFMAELLEMNNLVTENGNLYSVIKANQDGLVTDLAGPETGVLTANTAANTQLNDLLAELQAKKEALDLKVTDLQSGITDSLNSYYGLDANVSSLTVKDFLNKYDSDALTNFQDNLQEVETALQVLVGQRPSDDMGALTQLLQYSQEQLPKDYDHEKVLARFQPTVKDETLYQDLEKAYAQLESQIQAVAKEVKVGKLWIDNREGAFDQSQLTITSPSSSLQIDASSYKTSLGDLDDDMVELSFNYQITGPVEASGATITVSLNAPGLMPETQTKTTPQTQTAQVEVPKADGSGTELRDVTVTVDVTEITQTAGSPALSVEWEMAADLSSLASQPYQDALASYHTLSGRVVQLYETLHLLSTSMPKADLMLLSKEYLSLPIDVYLTEVVTTILSPTMAEHQTNLQDLDSSIVELQTSMGSLTSQIDNLNAKANDSIEAITSLISHYETLNQKVTGLQAAQADDQASQEEISAELQALLPKFETLSTSTQGLTSSTQQNLTEAEAIRTSLTSFESSISSAESSATELSTQAEALMLAFNEELTKNQDFVGAFVKVLNNAYNDGVPNEVLLDFLSNPVKGEGQAAHVTTDVYKPFTWILLIEVVSLLIAYLFSNNQIFKTTLDKFSRSSNPFLRAGSKAVIVQQMLSLILGVFIGLASLNQLDINPIYKGIWVLTVTLIMLFLSQWQYLLLSYLRSSGMGIALFVLVTYIYLTSAIGTTATLTGFPKTMRQTNLLAYFEGVLSGFFVDQPISGWSFVLIMLGLLGGIAIGLFVKPKAVQTAISEG